MTTSVASSFLAYKRKSDGALPGAPEIPNVKPRLTDFSPEEKEFSDLLKKEIGFDVTKSSSFLEAFHQTRYSSAVDLFKKTAAATECRNDKFAAQIREMSNIRVWQFIRSLTEMLAYPERCIRDEEIFPLMPTRKYGHNKWYDHHNYNMGSYIMPPLIAALENMRLTILGQELDKKTLTNVPTLTMNDIRTMTGYILTSLENTESFIEVNP